MPQYVETWFFSLVQEADSLGNNIIYAWSTAQNNVAVGFLAKRPSEHNIYPADAAACDPAFVAALPAASRWLLSKLSVAAGTVVKAMEGYEFATATQKLYSFWQYDLCDVYIELMKPVMAMSDDVAEQAAAKRGTRDALWIALDTGLRLLHPFMPFVTEELWQRLPKPPATPGQVWNNSWRMYTWVL